MSQEIIYRETYGSDDRNNIFLKSSGKIVPKPPSSTKLATVLSIASIKSFLKEVFLPKGFPESVHPDYIPYQIWDTIQAFASTILGALTTHSILRGVGVGESTATPLAAAISWILKDGTGMIGRILFAWWNGSELDAQSKKWRIFADVLNDIAMGIELTLPYFSASWVTGILCISTGMKSLVGVAGGATRAALTQHQALANNLADVSAKDGSQETFVNLLASFLGILLLSVLPDSFVFEMYLILVAVHIYANYSAVKSLRLNTLNEDRLALILNSFIIEETIVDVQTVNQQESLLLFQRPSKNLCGFDIKLGVSLTKVLNSSIDSMEYMGRLFGHFRHRQYLIIPDVNNKIIYVAFKKGAQSVDVINSYFVAYCYGITMSLRMNEQESLIKKASTDIFCKLYVLSHKALTSNEDSNKSAMQTLISVHELAPELFEFWYKMLIDSEWNHTKNLLPVNNWRGQWDY